MGLRQLDGDGVAVGKEGDGEVLQETVFVVEGYDLIDGDLAFGEGEGLLGRGEGEVEVGRRVTMSAEVEVAGEDVEGDGVDDELSGVVRVVFVVFLAYEVEAGFAYGCDEGARAEGVVLDLAEVGFEDGKPSRGELGGEGEEIAHLKLTVGFGVGHFADSARDALLAAEDAVGEAACGSTP